MLGDIAARRDPPDIDLAEAHYQQARALAGELGMRPLQAHCHRGLGTLYTTISQREQARAELSIAIQMYQSMAITTWKVIISHRWPSTAWSAHSASTGW